MHTDDQILPHIRWVPIRKSNCYLDVEKSQSNPIYKIAVDILKHTNFFRAFTASSTIPSIYIQQFWDTVRYDKSVRCYRCQLDEQWFDLTKDTLRDALQITPVNDNQAFTCPSSSDALINFVNELGYPKICEEFTQSIHTFIEDKRNLAQRTHGKKKATLIVIPSIRFTMLIIYHLQRQHKFHPRPDSPLYLPNEEHVLGYLKFSAKGTKREIFGMPIPGKPSSTLKSVDESVAEDVPAKEPRVDDEEADVQRALEESMKSMYDVPQGPLPPVVIREPMSGKYQPLPKKSPADQYILQRRTSTPTRSSGHDESSSLYVELGLTDSEEESEEVVPGADAGGQGEGQARPDPSTQAEGQTRPDPGAQDEGQARSNPNEQLEGQAGPDPSNAKAYQPMSSHVVHAGLDQNLKLTVEERVLLEEPARSSGTLSSLQHLTKDLSFGDLFFSDKPSEADNDKANVETEAESMVYVTIQQDMSSIPPMTSPIIDLTSRPESPKMHQLLKATATETTTTTILPPPSQQQQSITDAMMMKRIGELEHIMANLIQENKRDLPEADMKEILHQRMWETDSYKSHEDHMQLYEALEKLMNRDHSEELAKDLAEARKKKKKSRESPKMPPGSPPHQPSPPPPLPCLSRASGSSGAFGSSQVSPPPPPLLSTNQEDKDMALDEHAQSSNDGDIESAHIPKVNLRQDWWKPLEKEQPATPEPAWLISSSDVLVPPNNWASALASNYLPPLTDSLFAQTGDIAMFMDWFCSRPALSISKMKVAYYPDVVLEKMVPDQMWIEEECEYDIAVIAIRTHMQILSVVRIEVFSMYGYDYIKKIVLRRADLNEHVIAKRDFKYLYPSDFEDLYLLNLQEDFQLGIESYQTQLNLTKPRSDAMGFEYKHDYTVIDSPRAVTFQDRYEVQMIMRFNEIYKLSDGTLQHIDEALDYRVKEFKINRMNPGLNTRF
nr:hypothetical protein [Tanacetum cinerariifolium]